MSQVIYCSQASRPRLKCKIVTNMCIGGRNTPKRKRATPAPLSNVDDIELRTLRTVPPSSCIEPKVRGLVCESCWRTIFLTDAFWAMCSAVSMPPDANLGRGCQYTTPPWSEVQRSAAACQWCRYISRNIRFYRSLQRGPTTEPSSTETFRVTVRIERPRPTRALTLRTVIEGSGRPNDLLIHASHKDPAAQHIPERDVIQQMNAPSTYDMIKECIRECNRHHTDCPKPVRTRLPTRVIDCFNPSRPSLFVRGNNTEHAYYTALSYVWGEHQPHKTTTENYAAYCSHIDTRYIPQTIRDAIIVTHTLGLRYLWVDAFCIIQDSDDDKAVEIARIRTTFQHAFVTIVAASSHKVSEGFLHDRPACGPAPTVLPFRCPDEEGAFGTMMLREGDWAPSNEPVNYRAWCLEERILSPRTLLYCSHTLQYQCQSAHKNINGATNFVQPRNPADRPPRLPPSVYEPDSESDDDDDGRAYVLDSWNVILGAYTARALTKPRDRLLALSGVAEHFQRFWPESRYIGGLWEHELPRGLLWRLSGNPAKSPLRSRPSKYRAPSWSWASVDGGIEHHSVHRLKAVCEVVRCNAVLARPNILYGQVIGGRLVLDVVLREVSWSPAPSDLDWHLDLFEMNNTSESLAGDFPGDPDLAELCGGSCGIEADHGVHPRTLRLVGRAIPDAEEAVSQTRGEGYMAILHAGGHPPRALGMLLVLTESGEFERIGFVRADHCDMGAWLSASPQRIEIM